VQKSEYYHFSCTSGTIHWWKTHILPTVTIAAKNFATEITNFNVKQHELQGEVKITGEHVKNIVIVNYFQTFVHNYY